MRISQRHVTVIFFVLFLTAVYFVVPSVNYSNCVNRDKFAAEKYSGLVIEKYLDREQHSEPIVKIVDHAADTSAVSFFGDRAGLFDQILKEDFIAKKAGSNEIRIVRGGELKPLVFVGNCGCDTTKLKEERYLFFIYDFTQVVPHDSNPR